MKSKAKKHILLGIPCEDHRVHIPVAAFACRALKEGARRGNPFRFSVAFLAGRKPTEYARNCLVTTAIDNKSVDALWFIDSDMTPSENSFDLLGVKADIVAGIAPILSDSETTHPSFTYNMYHRVEDVEGRDFLPIASRNGGGPMDVDGVGTACMIISRKVLTDKRLWLGKRTKEGTIPLFRWPRDVDGATLGTDDLDFCRRARALGYTIKAVPRVVWGHLKEVDLQWMINKLLAVTYQDPSRITTLNEWNTRAQVAGTLPVKYIYQHLPQPSGEAAK